MSSNKSQRTNKVRKNLAKLDQIDKNTKYIQLFFFALGMSFIPELAVSGMTDIFGTCPYDLTDCSDIETDGIIKVTLSGGFFVLTFLLVRHIINIQRILERNR